VLLLLMMMLMMMMMMMLLLLLLLAGGGPYHQRQQLQQSAEIQAVECWGVYHPTSMWHNMQNQQQRATRVSTGRY
jgi:hypothetical protein